MILFGSDHVTFVNANNILLSCHIFGLVHGLLLMSLFLLSYKSAVGGVMLLEVTIRYLFKLLVEAAARLLYSLIFKLALRDLKFSLKVTVLTKGWGPIN
jgi:hypothetical protein